METIQVVMDKQLLVETDRAARRVQQNRSQLVRDALRAYLRVLEAQALEAREREGYMKRPQVEEESAVWDTVQTWPAE